MEFDGNSSPIQMHSHHYTSAGQISNWTHAFQFNPKRFRSPRADAIDVSSGIDKEKLTFYIPAFLAHFTALLIFCSISRVAEQD